MPHYISGGQCYLPLDACVLHDTADVVGSLQAALAGAYHLGVVVVEGGGGEENRGR